MRAPRGSRRARVTQDSLRPLRSWIPGCREPGMPRASPSPPASRAASWTAPASCPFPWVGRPGGQRGRGQETPNPLRVQKHRPTQGKKGPSPRCASSIRSRGAPGEPGALGTSCPALRRGQAGAGGGEPAGRQRPARSPHCPCVSPAEGPALGNLCANPCDATVTLATCGQTSLPFSRPGPWTTSRPAPDTQSPRGTPLSPQCLASAVSHCPRFPLSPQSPPSPLSPSPHHTPGLEELGRAPTGQEQIPLPPQPFPAVLLGREGVWVSRKRVVPGLTLSGFSSEPFRITWASGTPIRRSARK